MASDHELEIKIKLTAELEAAQGQAPGLSERADAALQKVTELQAKLDKLEKALRDLSEEFYRNNFSSSQDFQKFSRFNSRLKVPSYSTNPTVGEVGEVIEVGGKLKICTVASLTAPTWTIVGTQS